MKYDVDEKLKEIDSLIRQGEGVKARALLKYLLDKKVPRRHTASVATLARRLALHMTALKLLSPIVHPSKRALSKPTALEIAEYATCLSYLGAEKEALKLLEELPPNSIPQVIFAKTSALVAQWDYKATIPLFTEYLNLPNLDAYQILIGQANLAAALVYERRNEEAGPLLEQLKKKTEVPYRFLYGKILDLSAQLSFFQKDWKTTEHKLALSDKALNDTKGLDSFFVKKWRTFAEVMKEPESKKNLSKLSLLREEAGSLQQWGTLRQCDYYEAVATKNAGLFLKVYFGTPYESIRKNLLQDWGSLVEIPKTYNWQLGGVKSNGPAIALFNTAGLSPYPDLKPGLAPFRMLNSMTHDFYSPAKIMSLHFALYPDQHFIPVSSTQRVHEVIKRTRRILANNKSPIVIDENANQYFLKSEKPCSIEIPLNRNMVDRRTFYNESLRAHFGDQYFTANSMGAHLGVTPSAALKILEPLMADSVIEKIGSRKNSQYRFVREYKKTG